MGKALRYLPAQLTNIHRENPTLIDLIDAQSPKGSDGPVDPLFFAAGTGSQTNPYTLTRFDLPPDQPPTVVPKFSKNSVSDKFNSPI